MSDSIYQIEKCSLEINIEWNDFVYTSSTANIFHLFEWKKILEESYKIKTHYLTAKINHEIVGILPSAEIKNLSGKTTIISLPFTNYAGLLIKQGHSEKKLADLFLEYYKKNNFLVFENRQLAGNRNTQTDEYTMQLELPNNSKELWNKLDAKVRNQVRKAQRSGLNVVLGQNQLPEFYSIYSRHIKTLGTPVHSFLFFQKIIEYLKDSTDILTVRINDKVIGAMFITKFNGFISDPWAASLKKFLPYNPNMLMYWEILKYSCDNGYKIFDFGRSQIYSGTYKFKSQWGAIPVPLEYKIFSNTPGKIEASTTAYRNQRAKYFSLLWKNLPYSISVWLGPKIRKHMP